MHSQDVNISFSPFNGLPWVAGNMTGREYREHYPVTGWLYNPWTGKARTPGDRAHDPMGCGIVPPDELAESMTIRCAVPSTAWRTKETDIVVLYEVEIRHGDEVFQLRSTSKAQLGNLCIDVLRGMK